MRFSFLRITESNVLRVLALGFLLVMTLLGAAGLIAVRQSQRIRSSVAQLARDQLLIARLVHDVQMEENAMTEVLHQVAEFHPTAPEHAKLLRDLEQSDAALSRLADEARVIAGDQVWLDLESSVKAFTAEARKVLGTNAPVPRSDLESLFRHHDHVVGLVNDLIQSSSDRLAATEREIEAQSQELGDDAALLLGASFLLAAVCAALTVFFARKSIQRIRWQSDELNRVSWHMLQTQEETARRFSHELHDELGQSLAAVRANLTSSSVGDQVERRADCVHLVDEAIANVRELSQLLRPVILDDFGLEAGLRWLSEKFSQRTRIKVDYECTLAGRLLPDTETHLFRIAQEALTNIARHSQATKILITLAAEVAIVRLVVQDDGCGISPDRQDSTASLGLIGMRARARECGGTLDLQSVQPSGLRIVVEVPLKLVNTDES